MSTREFRLPDLGEGLTESDLVSWHVAAGDRVELNQVIAEVETAKALVDLPSPYAGVVTVLHAEPGQTVNVGEPLVTFEVPDEAGTVPPDGAVPTGRPAGGGEDAAEEAPQPNLVGYGARPERAGRPARRARRGPAGAPAEIGLADAGDDPQATTSPVPAGDGGPGSGQEVPAVTAQDGGAAAPAERPRSTPPVRRLAKQLGVHLERIVGTGARGLVTREDVLAAVSCAQGVARDGTGRERDGAHGLPGTASTGPVDEQGGGHGAPGAPGDLDDDEYPPSSSRRSGPTALRDLLGQSGLARAAARRTGGFPPPEPRTAHDAPARGTGATSSGRAGTGAGRGPGDPAARETRTPVRGVRKHTAAAMVASAFTAPHATVFLTVDVTPGTELLERLRTHPLARGTRITVLALVARALCVVLPRHPSLASRWEDLPDGSAEIVHSPRVHLGIAVATDRGLVVPHVPDAHRLGLTGLAEALADLTATARSGRTAPERLTGGTLTITNVGVFGVDAGTPILVPGEAAILGVGAVRRRPWEHEGQVALRDVVTLSLSFDHRVVDGEQGARFLAELGALLADPALALLLVGDPADAADPVDRGAPSTGGAS
ncbi:2-oxo acid dehydrogenase subunit E2 [Oerskovia sp. Sa1BUA8]|uniref:Dihydrolipoamide acetyltransferase component of pyruvate dehydrogenase complex n=1 Tax=Oerskovia douganii TaxID=2762210 RepID=A0A9D5YYS5_9CELL|nr:dihydrolipoamide acetyltransferase family protein [Oerskovia douganii]MBE7699821.1 2-oxo acid dehydrogenase subunit E2 [Oerskovia douganii]